MFRRLSAFLVALLLASTASAASLREQMNEVEKIRGLTFVHDVKTRSISRAELPEQLRKQIEKSMPYSLDDYVLVLRSLHLLEPGPRDVIPQLFAFLQQQVLAFYDPKAKTYYSIRELPTAIPAEAPLDTLEEGVVIHELTHALQDQRFGIGEHDYELRNDWDRSLAYHSVIEGEATLVMLAHMLGKMGQKLDDVIQNDMLVEAIASAASNEIADKKTPRYFVDSLKFPYVDGLRFVVAAYKRGGWKALDRVHANPPISSREILNPEEYFARVRRGGNKAPLFDTTIAHAKNVLTVEHLGAFHWAFLVGQDNAQGWVDDKVAVVQNAYCAPTVLVETTWSTPERAKAFADAYRKFLRDRGAHPAVEIRDAQVKVAYGADDALMVRHIP